MSDKLALNEIDLSKIADELLKTSYARHLVREEANRQIEAWIKWRIVPAALLLGTVAAFFGWKESSFNKKVEANEMKVAELDKRTNESQERINTMKAQLDDTKGLIKDAREAAAAGNQTVLASLGLVKDTSKDVQGVNNLLWDVGNRISKVNTGLSDLESQRKDLDHKLTKAETGIAALSNSQQEFEEEFQSLSRSYQQAAFDFRRFRAFHVQILQTGRPFNNEVVFGDPEGTLGPYRMTLKNLSEEPGSSIHFSFDIELLAPDSKELCASEERVMMNVHRPYALSNLKERIPGCLPKEVKLFIDATPHVAQSGEQPTAQFVILRVDTELSGSQ
jgi:hypothetical protein